MNHLEVCYSHSGSCSYIFLSMFFFRTGEVGVIRHAIIVVSVMNNFMLQVFPKKGNS